MVQVGQKLHDLATARWGVGGSGISTNALAFANGAGPPSSRLSASRKNGIFHQ